MLVVVWVQAKHILMELPPYSGPDDASPPLDASTDQRSDDIRVASGVTLGQIDIDCEQCSESATQRLLQLRFDWRFL